VTGPPGDPTDEGVATPPDEAVLAEDPEDRSLANRLKHQREHVVERLEDTRRRLEEARPRSRTIDTAFRALERDVATGGGVLSAAVAFRVFLFLIPYVFVVVTGFGVTADASGESPRDLARSAGITGLVANAFAGVSNLSTTQRISALAVSLFALFLAARALVKVLRITSGLIWRVPVPKLVGTSRVAAAATGLITLAVAGGALVAWIRSQSVLLGILGLVLLAIVPFGVWLLASWFLPRADCPWWALLPGAAVVGIGATGLHAFTVYWIARSMESKSDTYGAIGMSLALLLWAYVLGRIVTASIAVNASFWYRDEERHGRAVPGVFDLEERLAHPEDGTT
jgi:uncharacterized BrkB/YihY/UPF0761 family membrane protein